MPVDEKIETQYTNKMQNITKLIFSGIGMLQCRGMEWKRRASYTSF